MSIIVDEDMELVGAVVDGPDGTTHIESETFCYRNINEFQKSRSIGMQISGIWDPANLETGSKIPVTVSEDYHHKVEKGTTKVTVAGTDTDGGDPLHIRDLENSDDLADINRDRDNVQERHTAKDKHVRVFLPVPSFVLKGVWNTLIEPSGEVNPISIREQLLEAAQEQEPAGSEFFDTENKDILVGQAGDYMAIAGRVFENDPRGPVDYEEIVDLSIKNSGATERIVSHDSLGGTVTIAEYNDQRKTTVRISEERFLEMMGFEQAFLGGGEVSGDGIYYCHHDDEPIVFNKEDAIASALEDVPMRFAQGVGEGMLNAVTDTWSFIKAYAELQMLANSDPEAFDRKVREDSAVLVKALQNEEFWEYAAEAIAEELSTPEGLGRVTGEMLAGGIVGRFAKLGKVKHAAKLAESSAIRLGTLKKIGENAWESAGGLLYKGLDPKGLNRIEHILLHTEPNPAKPLHSVFNVKRSEVLKLIDEAWTNKGTPLPNDPGAYLVPVNKVVGLGGENAIKIVVEAGTSKLITAYPVKLP